MKFIKFLCLVALLFFVVLFLFGCSVEASSNKNTFEKCIITTSSGDIYKDVNKNTIHFNRNDYILNFKSQKNKSISTNSFTTSCEGDSF